MNFILHENQNAGTIDWQLKKPSDNHEIEGFASKTSVFPGEEIKFYINCKSSTFSIDIYRMGWYEGKGGRLMHSITELDKIDQPEPEKDSRRKIECFWEENLTLQIPENWITGVYLCKLTSLPDKFESYIIFAVKQAAPSKSTYLFDMAVNTYQAYNYWGDYSLYLYTRSTASDHLVDRAYAVSFNRPYIEGNGAGQFFRWEYQLLRWMEKNGLDISYCTNHDLHNDNTLLSRTKVYIIAGHSEYWTTNMYNNIENSLDRLQVGIAFMGANAMYWQVRYEDSFNGVCRNIVCYKCNENTPYETDPIYSTNPDLVTARYRDPKVNRAEQKIIGQLYAGWFAPGKEQELIFTDTTHAVFKDTCIATGEKFPKIIGYEFDRVWYGYARPYNVKILAESPVTWGPNFDGKSIAHVTIYNNAKGNGVFASGTLSWSWGLDDYGHLNEKIVSEKLQKFTLNVFNYLATQRETNVPPDKPFESKAKQQQMKISYFSWWICGLLGMLVGNIFIEITSNTYESTLIGLVSGIVLGTIIGLIVDSLKINISR